MKTLFKVLGLVLLVVVALAAIAVSYLALKKPAQRPPAAEKIEATPERLAHGKYLAHHVSMCIGCHSEHTLAYSLPSRPGREGVAGLVWDDDMDFPGTLAAANITPDRDTGLGNWTDGEILRAIREGVDRNGKALFPIMPYGNYRHMSDEDAKSIVAYLRTLEPRRYEKPKKSLDPPMNFIEKFIPQPITETVSAPAPSDNLAYGKYLVTIGVCAECHTPKDDKGQPLPGMELAGGFEMKGPGVHVFSANITPHPSTYMGRATKEEFIGRFRAFANYTGENAPPAPKGRNTIMPWIAYAGLTDQDLGAIYDYLKTVPPVENKVNVFPQAP